MPTSPCVTTVSPAQDRSTSKPAPRPRNRIRLEFAKGGVSILEDVVKICRGDDQSPLEITTAQDCAHSFEVIELRFAARLLLTFVSF